MPAQLHADFVDVSMDNALARPDMLTVLGVPIDLSQIKTDTYVVAGIADHLTPWQNCYRSTQLLGGESRFILSTSGHIAALVNPPDNPKATYQINSDNPPDPQEWLAGAQTEPGSWWPDFVAWLAARCGPEKAAPEELGGGGLGRWSTLPAPTSSTPERAAPCTRTSEGRWAPTTSASPTN